MDDAALVRRLAIAKLEAKAAELRPQWAWTKAVLDPEYGFMAQYARVRPQPAEVPAPLAAEIERIEHRLGELEEVGEDQWTDELMAEAAQLEERRTEIDETIDGLAVYADKDRARAGCIVTIGDDGGFSLHQGLVERSAVRGAAAAGSSEAEDDGDEGSMSPQLEDDDDPASGPRLSSEQKLRKECGFSQLLVDDLNRMRRPAPRRRVRRLLAADRGQLLGTREEGARPGDRHGRPRPALGTGPRRRQEAGARRRARNGVRHPAQLRLHRSRSVYAR
jgi:ParB family chromosome partitioning protein